jgi:hypothetical protein
MMQTMYRDPIQAGSYKLSVQASEGHYCEPRTFLPSLDQYSLVEVGIMQNGRLVNPRGIPGFPEDLAEYFEDMDSPVAGFISLDLVKRIGLALEALG